MPASIKLTSSPCALGNGRNARSPVVDLDALPGSALLTTQQVAALSGYAEVTLRVWRNAGEGRGPRVTYLERRPRYRVSDVRAWIGADR